MGRYFGFPKRERSYTMLFATLSPEKETLDDVRDLFPRAVQYLNISSYIPSEPS